MAGQEQHGGFRAHRKGREGGGAGDPSSSGPVLFLSINANSLDSRGAQSVLSRCSGKGQSNVPLLDRVAPGRLHSPLLAVKRRFAMLCRVMKLLLLFALSVY